MDDSDKLREETLSTEAVFEGQLLHVFRDEAKLPDGSVSIREWIRHPGASAVLPVFDNGDVVLVRQFRYPLSEVFYEVPAGKIDTGEDEKATAARELREEAGLDFVRSHYLGYFYPSIGYTNEVIHLYTVWDLQTVEGKMEEDEFLITVRLPFRKAVDMIYSNEISDGKSAVTLLKAWHWWQQAGPFRVG